MDPSENVAFQIATILSQPRRVDYNKQTLSSL